MVCSYHHHHSFSLPAGSFKTAAPFPLRSANCIVASNNLLSPAVASAVMVVLNMVTRATITWGLLASGGTTLQFFSAFFSSLFFFFLVSAYVSVRSQTWTLIHGICPPVQVAGHLLRPVPKRFTVQYMMM